jgi:hypothetical protein
MNTDALAKRANEVLIPSLNPPPSLMLAAKSLYYGRHGGDQQRVRVFGESRERGRRLAFQGCTRLEAHVRPSPTGASKSRRCFSQRQGAIQVTIWSTIQARAQLLPSLNIRKERNEEISPNTV